MTQANVTERQAKYFESLRSGLEAATGKGLAEWVAIARTCPETGQRARLKWLKDNYGLLQNRASWVLSQAFGVDGSSWREPEALIDALWTDPASRAILQAIETRAGALHGAIRTARKGYTAWSREFQFAAVRPVRGGKAMLGLALTPDAAPGLEAPRNESWSERLKARLAIDAVNEVGDRIEGLLRAAWERS
jgi:hypothetical protein